MGKTSRKKQRDERQTGPSIMTTAQGKKVRLNPVSLIELTEIAAAVLAEFRERGEPVDPPTYTMTLAGGSEIEQPHDETTLEYPLELALKETDGDQEKAEEIALARTLANREAWALHQDALARAESEAGNRRTDYMLEEGVELEEPLDVEAWVEKRKRRNLPVPDDPDELRTACLLRTVLITEGDQKEAALEIMRLSSTGVRREKVAAALELFRRQMDGQESLGGLVPREGAGILDEQRAGAGSEDGVPVEDPAESLGWDGAVPDGGSAGGDDGNSEERGG